MAASLQLLHIENDDLVARALHRVLHRHGFEVDWLTDCSSATLVTERYSMGIFDIDLNDGSGVVLAETLLRRGIVSSACFYTACAAPEIRRHAQCLGPVLAKGSGPEALLCHLLATFRPGSDHQRLRKVRSATTTPLAGVI